MLNMKKASIREIQHNFKSVLEYLDHGNEILITKRNKVIAKIIPATEQKKATLPDFYKRARKSFPETVGQTISEIIDDDRKERI
jgi:prevent-host-death family protein